MPVPAPDSGFRPPRGAVAGLPLLVLVALAFSAGVSDPAPFVPGCAPAHGRLVVPQERKSLALTVRRQQDRPSAAAVEGGARRAVPASSPTLAARRAEPIVHHHVRVERTSLPPPRA